MTKCKICNREVDTEGDWWCIACLNDYPTNNDYPADSDDVAEWAADRARKYYVCAHEQAKRFLEQHDD